MNTKSLQIHFNAPVEMKKKFNKVIHQAGVSANDAYRIFMQQTINHNGLPFQVTANHLPKPSSVNFNEVNRRIDDVVKNNDVEKHRLI